MIKLSNLKPKVASLNTAKASASAGQRLTGRPWRRMRERVLKRDGYLCQHCLPDRVSVATDVDHIVPVHLGGGNGIANLMSLCAECHQAKTEAEETARRGG